MTKAWQGSYNSHHWDITGYSLIWDPCVDLHKHVEVYTLSTNSWRQINCDTISDIHVFGGCCEIYLNGAYHWSGRPKEKDYNIIVSFDMSNEVFGILSMPDLTDISHFNQIWQALAVLGNCVASIVYNICAPEKTFDIWVMHEYGVKESWTKQYVIGPLSGIRKLVGPANSGHILLLGDKIFLVEDNGQVVVYNLNAQQIKNLQVSEHPTMAYVESLVSIMGRNVIEN
ncbi:hypothetical protein SO802_024294 [Lithocarpus litseifolius]|uniref:F-box associated beta-propeller type 1 domain-containing protein n=1 Tax=Lithocarpus litseifolius TaxID=425828 RepID=A0AAW2C8F3_9ROSI